MIDVTVTTTLVPKVLDQWSYTLTFEIPTVVSADGRYFVVVPELNSESTLFGVSLNIKKAVSTAQALKYPPGAPGISIPYVKTEGYYGDQSTAEKNANDERDNGDRILRTISNLYASVSRPIIQTFTYP
jgi:hypothetical protein